MVGQLVAVNNCYLSYYIIIQVFCNIRIKTVFSPESSLFEKKHLVNNTDNQNHGCMHKKKRVGVTENLISTLNLLSAFIQGGQTKCRQIFIQITLEKRMLIEIFAEIIVCIYIEMK